MTLKKTYLGQNPDGTPHFHYESDGHVVLTGKAYGPVVLADGTEYDVSEDVIEVDPQHAGELAHHIGVMHEEKGHPDHEGFVHECDEHCGGANRKAKK